MKKIILLCGLFIITAQVSLAIAPPPAYIQTHQTSQNVSAENPAATSTPVPTNTVSEPVAPPTIIPPQLPANQGQVTADFTVTSVVVTETKIDVQTGTSTAKVIEFQGHAKPNTYITLYIYSTPIIVTVATDSQGNWKYDLDQELDNGVHRVYVAQIDNSGNVVAKSDPIFFNKAAASAQIVSSGLPFVDSPQLNFFQRYYILVCFIILALAILVGLLVVGCMGRKSSDSLPPESPEKSPDNTK